MRNPTRLVDNNTKHSRLAATAQLHIHNFQTAGVRYPRGNLADSLHLKRHRTSTLRPTAHHSNKKWAFAHWCVSPNPVVLHNSFRFQIYAALGQKTTRSGKWCSLMSS